MRKRFFWIKYLIFSIFFIVILFLCLESLARIYLFVRHKEERYVLDNLPMALISENRIFELKPNYYQKHKSQEFEIDIQTNSNGLRDVEHSILNQEEAYRIIALGNSFTFGWGVNQEETWWKILEEQLNNNPDAKYKYEMINLGVWMYTFDQQFLRLKDKGLKYNPDLVVHGIYWPHLRTITNHNWEVDSSGDIKKIYDPTTYVSAEGLLKSKDTNIFLSFFKNHSKLLNFIISKLQVFFLKDQLITSDLVFLQEGSIEDYREVWQKTFESIKQTKRLLDQHGIQYYVFLIPREVQLSENEWYPLFINYMNEQMYENDIPQKNFIEFFDELEISYIDLLPVFRSNYKSSLYFQMDPHWTKIGHELASEEIFNFLKRESFVK
jgi:fumarate reductase subunit C